ncbi:MAG: response regulator [Rickettsiales bacterium]|nr:response regulator [Rickettsiales bacterium]
MSTTTQPLIIFAEDDPSVFPLAKAVLGMAGYEVHHHESGKGALDELKSLKKEIEAGRQVVLVTDYNMPEMNGAELVKALFKEKIAVPTLMATSQEDDAAALGMLVDNIVKKPFSPPSQLTDAIPAAIARFEALAPGSGGMAAKVAARSQKSSAGVAPPP